MPESQVLHVGSEVHELKVYSAVMRTAKAEERSDGEEVWSLPEEMACAVQCLRP